MTKMGPDGVPLGSFPTGGGPEALLFDGRHIWVANNDGNTIERSVSCLNLDGETVDTYMVGTGPVSLGFDGTAIWVGNFFDSTVTKTKP